MRKLIVSEFITLDGVIQGPGGKDEDRDGGFEHGGWTVPFWHDDIGKSFDALMKDCDALLLGRRTYVIHAQAFEPMPPGDPFGDMMNAPKKYVVSRTLEKPIWRDTTIIRDNVIESVRALKTQPGRNILTDGSSQLVHALLEKDLVDELHLLVYPLALGSGKRLLPSGVHTTFAFISATPYRAAWWDSTMRVSEDRSSCQREMKMTVLQAVLVLATFLCSLVAGFLFAFAVVIMPGIRSLDDGGFIRAFQVIDRVIQNNQPLFIFMWAGSVLSLIGAAVLGLWELSGTDRALVIVAALVYILCVQLPTVTINIPLNNELKKLDPGTMNETARKRARDDFEPRWNRWNAIRAAFASVASLLLLLLLIRV